MAITRPASPPLPARRLLLVVAVDVLDVRLVLLVLVVGLLLVAGVATVDDAAVVRLVVAAGVVVGGADVVSRVVPAGVVPAGVVPPVGALGDDSAGLVVAEVVRGRGALVGVSGSSVRLPEEAGVEPSAGTVTSGTPAPGVTAEPVVATPVSGRPPLLGATADVPGEAWPEPLPQAASNTAAMP